MGGGKLGYIFPQKGHPILPPRRRGNGGSGGGVYPNWLASLSRTRPNPRPRKPSPEPSAPPLLWGVSEVPAAGAAATAGGDCRCNVPLAVDRPRCSRPRLLSQRVSQRAHPGDVPEGCPRGLLQRVSQRAVPEGVAEGCDNPNRRGAIHAPWMLQPSPANSPAPVAAASPPPPLSILWRRTGKEGEWVVGVNRSLFLSLQELHASLTAAPAWAAAHF